MSITIAASIETMSTRDQRSFKELGGRIAGLRKQPGLNQILGTTVEALIGQPAREEARP